MKERKFIEESVKRLLITEYVRKEIDSAGFGGMDIRRTPFGTTITLYVNKPGLVIGRKGAKIQEITNTLDKVYGLESPQVEVKEVENADLNPNIVAKKIALSLEKGWSYRRAGNTALRRTMEQNAPGVLIRLAGKISGERSRSQKFINGSVKYAGEPARAGMKRGIAQAKLKLGIIGISVGILDPKYKLPDVIEKRVKPAQPVVQGKVEVLNGAQGERSQKNE
ncbi:MAG: 30S ribosomal protein S3 [Candidatus Thermoplasmatota archaeon]|jgi:small subunit ribosomal protein S3|nr:30S ribosomal protein S3 [Candidatus Thermoplasmatota archaeon]MCL5786208.1 30S ribosomal protein S3 [Candidatus Thermoplasmatota archaeon]